MDATTITHSNKGAPLRSNFSRKPAENLLAFKKTLKDPYPNTKAVYLRPAWASHKKSGLIKNSLQDHKSSSYTHTPKPEIFINHNLKEGIS